MAGFDQAGKTSTGRDLNFAPPFGIIGPDLGQIAVPSAERGGSLEEGRQLPLDRMSVQGFPNQLELDRAYASIRGESSIDADGRSMPTTPSFIHTTWPFIVR